jgi:hypothetical protein
VARPGGSEEVEHGVSESSLEHGDTGSTGEDRELAYGEGLMPGGRVSVAHEVKPGQPTNPFTQVELSQLDEALTLSTRESGIDFSVYLGPLGDGDADTRAEAEKLHASVGSEAAADAVLLAVSPEQRKVEIVTGEHSVRRLPDRSCKLAVMSMVASFTHGDLVGGLLGGLRMLTDQAGPRAQH